MVRALFAIALILFLPSCRSLTGPESAGPVAASLQRPQRDAAARNGSREVRIESLSQVPRVVRADVSSDGHDVLFRFHLAPDQPGTQPFYDPHTPGGWQFQLFLDTDEDPVTGYAGFEMLTRDSEPSLPLGVMVLRRTEGGGGPGGWGEAVAEIPMRVSPRLITFRLPLERLGDDGALRYGLELYATVTGGLTGSDPVAAFGRAYTGTSSWQNRTTPLLAGADGNRLVADAGDAR